MMSCCDNQASVGQRTGTSWNLLVLSPTLARGPKIDSLLHRIGCMSMYPYPILNTRRLHLPAGPDPQTWALLELVFHSLRRFPPKLGF